MGWFFATAQASAATDSEKVDLKRAKQQLEEVLAQPAFQQWQRRQQRAEGGGSDPLVPEAWQQWIADTREGFFDWIESWFRSSPRASPGGSGNRMVDLATVLETLAWLVLAVLGLFVLGVAVRLIAGARPKPAEQSVSRQRLREAMDTGEALAAESPQWLAEADQLAAEQDLRRAYRALYLALLSGLHRTEQIDFRRNRTNWTYVRQFRGETEQRRRLSQLTEQFDEIWYGRRSPREPSMQHARTQVQTLLKSE